MAQTLSLERCGTVSRLPGPFAALACQVAAGAVGNALTTLADRAEASRITGKPVRYEANAATAAAAAAITPKAPAPPKPASRWSS